MRILLCHNYYSNRGGEDQSFEHERDLLLSRGETVESLTIDPQAATQLPQWQVGLTSLWNRPFAKRLAERIRSFQPQVVHFTNTFPLMSPAAIRMASRSRTATVVSLRNYRLVCPAATLFREGKDCHACLGKTFAWPAIQHGCYRNKAASAVVAGGNALHGVWGTWNKHVDQFFTLSELTRERLIQGGLPASRLAVKPNFALDPGFEPNLPRAGGVFVGRLVAEKGVELLLREWQQLVTDQTLTIIGSGPLEAAVRAAADSDPRIQYLGELSHAETLHSLRRARVAIVPSLWAEPFGRVVIEAFAVGTPVLASNRGAFPELVEPGRTGEIFDPDQLEGFPQVLRPMLEVGPLADRMSQQCRLQYVEQYSELRQYELLTALYRQAIEHRASRYGSVSRGDDDKPHSKPVESVDSLALTMAAESESCSTH